MANARIGLALKGPEVDMCIVCRYRRTGQRRRLKPCSYTLQGVITAMNVYGQADSPTASFRPHPPSTSAIHHGASTPTIYGPVLAMVPLGPGPVRAHLTSGFALRPTMDPTRGPPTHPQVNTWARRCPPIAHHRRSASAKAAASGKISRLMRRSSVGPTGCQ